MHLLHSCNLCACVFPFKRRWLFTKLLFIFLPDNFCLHCNFHCMEDISFYLLDFLDFVGLMY